MGTFRQVVAVCARLYIFTGVRLQVHVAVVHYSFAAELSPFSTERHSRLTAQQDDRIQKKQRQLNEARVRRTLYSYSIRSVIIGRLSSASCVK